VIDSQNWAFPSRSWRSGLLPLRFRVEGRTRESARKTERPPPALTNSAANPEKKKAFYQRQHERALRVQDCQLLHRLHAHARSGEGTPNGTSTTAGIAFDVARRLHHSFPLLGKIKKPYDNNPSFSNLLLDEYFRGEIKKFAERLA